MIVVSDASPVLNLSVVGRLDILHKLYQRVFIPSEVADELARNDLQLTDDWILIANPRDSAAVNELQTVLDRGESEAIILAEEYRAELLLIDERRGWKIASARSLHCVGLLGVFSRKPSAGAPLGHVSQS